MIEILLLTVFTDSASVKLRTHTGVWVIPIRTISAIFTMTHFRRRGCDNSNWKSKVQWNNYQPLPRYHHLDQTYYIEIVNIYFISMFIQPTSQVLPFVNACMVFICTVSQQTLRYMYTHGCRGRVGKRYHKVKGIKANNWKSFPSINPKICKLLAYDNPELV